MMPGGGWPPGWGTCAVSLSWCSACRGAGSRSRCRWRRALGAPLDVIVVRKLGVPFQPELGMGAVGEDGVRVLNPEVIQACGVSQDDLAAVQAREQAAVDARAARYRAVRPREPLAGRVAVVVDDGIATGSTARAACQIARAHGAARVVLAVPVAPPGWQARIGAAADEMVCVGTPRGFFRHRAVLRQVPPGLRRGGSRLPGARRHCAVVRAGRRQPLRWCR